MKTIDAEKLNKQLNLLEKFNNKDVPKWVRNIIDSMPEVITRCKDCIHFHDGEWMDRYCDLMEGGMLYAEPDAFCSDAERRKE